MPSCFVASTIHHRRCYLDGRRRPSSAHPCSRPRIETKKPCSRWSRADVYLFGRLRQLEIANGEPNKEFLRPTGAAPAGHRGRQKKDAKWRQGEGDLPSLAEPSLCLGAPRGDGVRRPCTGAKRYRNPRRKVREEGGGANRIAGSDSVDCQCTPIVHVKYRPSPFSWGS